MKKYLALALVILTALSIPGTAALAEAKETVEITLTAWGSTDERDAITAAAKAYDEYTGYTKTTVMHIPNADFLTKLNAMIASGEAPDISYSSEWKCQMGKDGLFYNFYDLLEQDPIASVEDWLPLSWWNWSETESAGPVQANVTPTLMYNVDMFDELGIEHPPTTVEDAWSWEAFVNVAQRLTLDTEGRNALDPDFDPDSIAQFGIQTGLNDHTYMPLVYSNGGGYLSEDMTSLGLAEPQAYEQIQKIADLINVYHVHPSSVQANSLPSVASALASRKVAMYIGGSWFHLDLSNADLNWGVGVLPIDKDYTTYLTGGSLIIFKSTKHIEEVWGLYKWITTPESCLSMFQTIWMPVHKAYYEDPEKIELWASEELSARPAGFQDAVMRSAYENQVRSPSINVINFTEINEHVTSSLESVWLGTKTAEQAMTECAEIVKPLIQGTYFADRS